MKTIALIPARAGSKRCPGKNTRMFFGRPLIAYTIRAAKDSGVFDAIYVSSDDEQTLRIALFNGVDIVMRPDYLSTDTSRDLEWITHALSNANHAYSFFAILRPTSPFRSAELIRDAWEKFKGGQAIYDSLRTMERQDHPCKMWIGKKSRYTPLLGDVWRDGCDSPTQNLHKIVPVLTQNGCLQIARTSLLPQTITGTRVYGYDMTGNLEGFDINTELDWILAEELVKRGMVKLPGMSLKYTNPHITEESLRQSVLSSSRIEGVTPPKE